jgi:hypothetical protein
MEARMNKDAMTKQNSESHWLFSFPFTPVDAAAFPFRMTWGDGNVFLNERRKNLASWADRRQEAFSDGMRVVQALINERDPEAWSKLSNECLEKATRRFFADLSESRDEMARLAQFGGRLMTAAWTRDDSRGANVANPDTPAPSGQKVHQKRQIPVQHAA